MGYHASREGLNDLRDAQNDAARARRANRALSRNRLQSVANDHPVDAEESKDEEVGDEERVTFHPGVPILGAWPVNSGELRISPAMGS